MADLRVDSFKEWLDAYGKAWEERNAEAAVMLFSGDASYHESPYDEPMVGKEAIFRYWSEFVEETQRDVHFEYGAIAVSANRGFASWQASYVSFPSGNSVELDGCLMAEFDDVGKCYEFHEWWHLKGG